MVRQLATHTFGGGTGEPRRRFMRRRGERGQVEEQVEQPLKDNLAIRRIH